MASIYEHSDYYKKMLELQEKLRKSEEERIRLEERFNILSQESKNRHGECINRLRLRYIEYLEEQRARDERNHKLLGALDKVDNTLSEMVAKTRRLNILRKQYEAYLLRVYRRNPGGTTGSSVVDSGVSGSQTERNDKFLKYMQTESTALARLQSGDVLSTTEPSTRSIDRAVSESSSRLRSPIRMEIQPETNRRNAERFLPNDKDTGPMINDDFQRPSSRQHADSFEKFNSARNLRPFSTRSFQQSQELQPSGFYGVHNAADNREFLRNPSKNIDIDGRSSTLWPGKIGPDKNWHSFYGQPSVSANVYDNGVRNRTTRVLENELDRYIENIRNLHRGDLETASVEEEIDHEQNTSGDLLNVTLSDEEQHFAENRQAAKRKERRGGMDERLPVEVEEVLALATDLASRTVPETEVKVCETDANVQARVSRGEKSNTTLESKGNASDEISNRNSETVSVCNDRNLLVGEISPIENPIFQTAENLDPWDLKFVEKQVREYNLDEGNESKELLTTVKPKNEESSENKDILPESVENNLKEPDSPVNQENFSKEESVIPENISTKEGNQGSEDIGSESACKNVEETEIPDHSQMINEKCDADKNVDEMNPVSEYEEYVENPVERSGEENYVAEQEYNNEEYQGNFNAAYQQQSNEGYSYNYGENYQNDPNQTYENDAGQFYGNDFQNEQNQYYEVDHNQQYAADPNQLYENDPNQQFANGENQNYGNEIDNNVHYEIEQNQQCAEDANQQYENDGNQEYTAEPNESYHDNNQDYMEDPNQSYENYPNQPVESSNAKVYDYAEENNYDGPNETSNLGEETKTHVEEQPQLQNVPESEFDKTEVHSSGEVQETEENSEKILERVQDLSKSEEGSKIEEQKEMKKKKDVIRSLLDSDTESTIERNVTNTDSDFDFN